MSIASEITRLQGCKANIRTALVNKGITSASTHNMADFATDISNISAGGATITVTYNSSFYNKTMTCTKGSTTYTQTTTSSGSTVFNVTDEGTWTITCNGVSRTVYVTLNYSTQMAVTKTVTVYSAANDTISFTDAVGSKTVTTNASGQGSVSITFIPPSQSITFTSSVAKNPNNLSAAYTKNINLSESTASIKVMPDGALYWYGWGNTSNFATIPSSVGARTINTNNVAYSTNVNSKGYYDIYNVSNTVGQKVHLLGTLVNNVSPYSGAIALQKASATLIEQGQLRSSQVYSYFGRYYDRDTSAYVGTYYTSETAYHISSGSTVDTPTHITFTWNQTNPTCTCKVNGIWTE